MADRSITLGIDLASRPANTALCAIEWGPQPIIRHLYLGQQDGTLLHDEFLVTTTCELRLDFEGAPIVQTAIDSPFGWPAPFVEAVRAAWLGLTAVPPARPGAAHSEGWIHVPTCPLQALIEPPAYWHPPPTSWRHGYVPSRHCPPG